MVFGIVELYHGQSGKVGFYNSQELGLARAMKKLGHTCVIFYPGTGIKTIEETVVEEHIKVVYVPAHTIGIHSWYDWRVLTDYHIEVAQIGSDNQLFVPSLVKFCNKHNIYCYHYVGVVGSTSNNPLKRMVMRLLYQRNLKLFRIQQVFAKTRSVYHAMKCLGVENVELAPVGLDFEALHQQDERMAKEKLKKEYGFEQQDKVLLLVGRMEADRNPFPCIEVFKQIHQKCPEYKLLVVGKGSLQDLFFAQVKQAGLERDVHHIPQLPNDKMWQVYTLAEGLLTFSEKEIFGMSILEAMYYYKVVFAFHAPGPDDILEDGKSGYLCKDVQSMVENILNCDWEVIGNNAHERIINNYTWSDTARLLETVNRMEKRNNKKEVRVLLCERSVSGHRMGYMRALTGIKDVHFFVVAPKNPGVLEEDFFCCGSVKQPKSIKAYRTWIKQIKQCVRDWKIDIVHFLDGDSIMRFFGLGFHGIYANKIVITYHRYFDGLFRRISYACMCRHNIAVCHSEFVRNNLLKIGLKTVTECEYPAFSYVKLNSMNPQECKTALKIPLDVPVMGIVGGISKYKNILPFLHALRKVNSEFHILLAGKLVDIKQCEIEEAIEPYRDHVTWINRVLSDMEYNQSIVASDIIYCIYTKEFNGSSGPLTDAVSAKKMVLASNHGTIAELTEKYQVGYTVDCDNENEIIQCTEKILEKFPGFSYTHFAEEYRKSLNPEVFLEKYGKVYLKTVHKE